MKVARSLFPSITVGLALFSLLVLGIPVSGFASEPHTCINGVPSTSWQNLGNQATYVFRYHANCGTHTSNTTLFKLTVYNYNTGALICTDINNNNNGAGFPVPPYYRDVTCPGLPQGISAKIKAVIDYKVIGSSWMIHTDYFKNY